ncbi:MAG TPA: hypoxanthine-guanine phosphoribosyltransferase [Thiohalobacter sp.]|nr:hypoxanthine-guanine phosphoribosyltransferase [Thiohalobacter sp.]
MTDITPTEARRVLDRAECVHSAAAVQDSLDSMATAITERIQDANPLVISVMTGAIVLAGQLLPRLHFPLQLDYIHATRYRGRTKGGELYWINRPNFPLRGRTVLILDDILDEGLTLEAIKDFCLQEGAAAVCSAVLVQKRHDRCVDGVEADFTGLQVEDRYVFGCGMDYHGYHRNLPAIYAVDE